MGIVNESNSGNGNKKITVALLCTALNDLGGTSQFMADLYNHLDREFYQVLIVYASTKKNFLHDFFIGQGVKNEDLFWFPQSKRLFFMPLAVKLKKLFISQRVNIIHTFFLHSDIVGCFAALLAGKRCLISSVVGKFFWDEINGVVKLKQVCYKFCNGIIRHNFYRTITVSQQLSDELVKCHAVLAQKVVAISLGIVIPPDESINISRNNRKNVIIASLSRLTKDKGLEYLLQAVPYVIAQVPNARFIIASIGKEEKNLKQLAKNLHIQSTVEFSGWVSNAAEFMEDIDIFAIPSLREGCPLSLLEALSFAKPAVAFRVPGIQEIIQNGENGIMVEPFDVQQFASAIITLCKDKNYARKLGLNGRALVQEKFSISAGIGKIEQIYREALNKNYIFS